MTDLTKITTAFGLLDEETQRALKECSGPIEYYNWDTTWIDTPEPQWWHSTVYRQKPQPREYVAWQVVDADGDRDEVFLAKGIADAHATNIGGRVIKLTGRDDG